MKSVFNTLFFSSVILIVALGFQSCAPTSVYSDYSRSTDFKTYSSFAWLPKNHDPKQDSQFDNQIVETNIKNLASGELKKRGFKIDVTAPDILVDFHVAVANKVDHVSTPVYSYPYNYNNYNANQGAYTNNMYSYNNSYYNNNSYLNTNPMVSYRTQDIPYEEGTLTILLIDRKSNQLIWKGWSVGTVNDEQSFEYELPDDIRRLFKQFPVPIPKTK
jgi:hypothetical protein